MSCVHLPSAMACGEPCVRCKICIPRLKDLITLLRAPPLNPFTKPKVGHNEPKSRIMGHGHWSLLTPKGWQRIILVTIFCKLWVINNGNCIHNDWKLGFVVMWCIQASIMHGSSRVAPIGRGYIIVIGWHHNHLPNTW